MTLHEVEQTTGFPSPAQDHYLGPLTLDRHLIRHPDQTVLLRVRGDVLRSRGIVDGDQLVVDRASSMTRGALIVALVHGEPCVGWVQGVGGFAHLVTDVGSTPLGEEAETWGVVVASIHEFIDPRTGY